MKVGPFNLPVPKAEPKRKKKKDIEKQDIKKPDFSRKLLTKLDIKSIISVVIEFSKKLWRKLKPKYVNIRGIVGLNDPCATGQFLGWYEAITCALGLRKAIILQGDFTQTKLELELKLAGRFSVASLLGPCIWLYLQKPIRAGLKIFKEERAIS
jgi:hypothetical protein